MDCVCCIIFTGQRVSVPHETWSNSPPSVHQLTCPQQLETAGTSSNLASCTTISNQTTTTTSTYPLFPFSPIANTSPIPPAMVCLGNINAILLLQRTGSDTFLTLSIPIPTLFPSPFMLECFFLHGSFFFLDFSSFVFAWCRSTCLVVGQKAWLLDKMLWLSVV